jgi:hypothetical protein
MSLPSGTYSGLSSKQNRWTSDLMGSGVQEWFPPKGKDVGVEHYFASASSMIETECSGQGFHFHFTANIDTVPVTGPKSVVFVMSEEKASFLATPVQSTRYLSATELSSCPPRSGFGIIPRCWRRAWPEMLLSLNEFCSPDGDGGVIKTA